MTDKEEVDKIKKDIEDSQVIPLPCSLCYVETFGRGVFTADKKGTLGATPDTYRVIIYPLCKDCSYKPGYRDEIKRKILSEYN